MDFLRSNISPEEIKDKVVLEVGSLDVNGSPRTIIMSLKPLSYVGIDIRPGKGVDKVIEAENLPANYSPGLFDVIICTEMLEHAKNWRSAIYGIKYVLRMDGTLFLTCRSRGFKKHDHPADYWRFSVDNMSDILSDMEILKLHSDPQCPGVFVKAIKRTNQVADLFYIEPYEQL